MTKDDLKEGYFYLMIGDKGEDTEYGNLYLAYHNDVATLSADTGLLLLNNSTRIGGKPVRVDNYASFEWESLIELGNGRNLLYNLESAMFEKWKVRGK